MKIPGTNLQIPFTQNAAPEQRRVEGNTNDYADSVAGKLAQRYGRSAQVSVNGRPTGSTYNQETIEEIYQGYIFGAIKKTRNQVAAILTNNIEVYDPSQGNPKDAPALDDRHPYQDAIDAAPMDNTLFYAGIATYLMVLGEAFLDAGLRTMQAGNIKDTQVLELMQSNQVARTYNNDGELVSYKWTEKLPNGIEKKHYYVPSNIIPIIDLNPWDLRKGYGMIRPIVDKVALENMATKLQTSTLANGIKAPGIISSKEKLESDDYDDLKAKVNERYTSNDMELAGTPIVTNGGFLDYKSLLEDLDKLAMVKIRNMNRDAFFAALSVSKTILGIEESGTTRETSRVQREQFILDACMPLAETILSALNQDYINNYPVSYKQKKLKMRAVAPIEKDLEQEKAEADVDKLRAETFKTYIDAGMDPQQAAKKAGIPLEENETIIISVKPVNNKIELTPEQLAAIGRNSGQPAAAPVINNHIHQHDHAEIGQVAKNKLSAKEVEKINKAEGELRMTVKKLDGDLGQLYVKQVNNVEQADEQAYKEALTNALLAYYAVAMPLYARDRLKRNAQDFDVDLSSFNFNEGVREIVRARLAKVANSHFAEIDEHLTQIITNGTRDSLSRADIIKQVQAAISNEVETWQVERLVQTETSNAFNQATFLADKQFVLDNGYTGRAYKEWRTNSPRPCPFCINQAMRGRIPLDEEFLTVGSVAEGVKTLADGSSKDVYYPVRFVDVDAGGLHPNCRCDYTLVIE